MSSTVAETQQAVELVKVEAVERVRESEQVLRAELSSVADEAAAAGRAGRDLTEQVSQAALSAEQSHLIATDATERADTSVQLAEELRVDLDREVKRRIAERRQAIRDRPSRSASKRDKSGPQTPLSEQEEADRHRADWNEHLRVYGEQRRLREGKK